LSDVHPPRRPDTRRPAPCHARSDKVLERIYIGRRFKNDSKRLEKLLNRYARMTQSDH